MAQLEAQVLPTGAQIGVYEIKGVISSGRSGILYRAWNEHLNTMVALKEYLPTEYAIRDDDGHGVKAKRVNDASVYQYGMDKFLEFAEILTDIQQSNVVGVHNVLQFNGTAYLAMDFEEGVPLSKLQATSPSFTETELKGMLISLLNALQAVHDKDTVHGDVHPSNIIIRHDGKPVLVNFAAARLALAAHTKELLQELRSGYAPAELYHPDNLPGPRSDLFSLGATMYYCITRTDPGSILERVEAVNNNQQDPYQANLEEKGAGFSEGFLKSISWMLHQNADERPQSAREVLIMLDQEAGESRMPEVKSKITQDSQENIVDESDSDQSGTGFLIPGLIGIAALLAAGFWYLQQEKQPTESLVADANRDIDKPAIERIEPVEVTPEPSPEDVRMAVEPEIGKQEGYETGQEVVLEDTTRSAGSADETVSDKQQLPTGDSSESSEIEVVESLPDGEVVSSEEESISALQEPLESVSALQRENQDTPLTGYKKEKINQYLAAAEQNIAELHLTTPLEDNAYLQYQAVLAIDPDNIHAKEGMLHIIETYTWLIEGALEEKRFNRAGIYLERAEAIQLDAPDLQRLRNELNNAEQ